MRPLLALLSVAWLTSAAAGLLLLADYDSKPSAPASPPQRWPSDISLVPSSLKPTVLMFLHPHCPCSRASLSELARLAHSELSRLDLYVVFAQPVHVAAEWPKSDLWKTAVANRDWQVVIDRGGSLANQFGVKTSGQSLVYDAQGKLCFAGGITPGRGHSGDSFGRTMIKVIANGQPLQEPVHGPTFGCSLSANLSPTTSARSQ